MHRGISRFEINLQGNGGDKVVTITEPSLNFKSAWQGKGAQKKTRKKCGLLPNPPRTPSPPSLAFFSEQKIYPNFFLKIASIMAETNFTLGPTSKQINFLY